MKTYLLVILATTASLVSAAFADTPAPDATQQANMKALVATRIKLAAIYTAAASFQAQSKTYPSNVQELLKAGLDNVKDGWGREIIYTSDGTHFLATSLGADGKEGGTGLAADSSIDETKTMKMGGVVLSRAAPAQAASPAIPCGDMDNPCSAPPAPATTPKTLVSDNWIIKPRAAHTFAISLREPHRARIEVVGVRDTAKGFKAQVKPDEGGSGAVITSYRRDFMMGAGPHSLVVTNSENALMRMTVHATVTLDPRNRAPNMDRGYSFAFWVLILLVLAASGCATGFRNVDSVSDLNDDERILIGEIHYVKGSVSDSTSGLFAGEGKIVGGYDQKKFHRSAKKWDTNAGSVITDSMSPKGGIFHFGAKRESVWVYGIRSGSDFIIFHRTTLWHVHLRVEPSNAKCAYVGSIEVSLADGRSSVKVVDEFDKHKSLYATQVKGCEAVEKNLAQRW